MQDLVRLDVVRSRCGTAGSPYPGGSRGTIPLLRCCLAPVVAGVLLFNPALLRPVRADDGLDEYNVGVGWYNKGRWEQAADAFREFIRDYPRHAKVPLARLYLGLTLVQQKDYDDARTVLRGFVKDYPQSKYRPDAMYRVAECSYLLGEMKAAQTEFTAFLKADPDNDLAEYALPYLADAQRRSGNFEQAAQNYALALKNHPKSRMREESKFGLARSYEGLQRFDEAVELYRELAAEKAGSRAAESQMALATVYFDQKQYAQAAKAYEQLVDRFPESSFVPQAELYAGYSHYQAGDFSAAVARFERAGKHEQQSTTADYWKGISYRRLSQYAEAVEALKSAFNADQDGPHAQDALYQWAATERDRQRLDEARQRFLEVVRRWPQSELADDSLYYAAETALLAGKLEEGQDLIERFDREYAGSPLRMYNRLLGGRLRMARGTADDLKAAAARFRQVLEESRRPHTRLWARYYLAGALQKQGNDEEALQAVQPVVEQIEQEKAGGEFSDALILAAGSQLATEKYQDAETTTTLYLRLDPEGRQLDKALAMRATARARLNKQAEAQSDLTKLAAASEDSGMLRETFYNVAEIAYAKEQWDWAARLYESLVTDDRDAPNRAHALSGLAWSRFHQEKYDESAALFAQVVKEHRDETRLAAEAAFKRAESLQQADKLQEAADAYLQAFAEFAPQKPAGTGDEEKSPWLYAYRAGLYGARVLRQLKKVPEADKAYERLLTRFPRPKSLDERLDEWALLNYDAGNYKRSDEIFARLVELVPQSDLADNARLSLAESDLIAGKLDEAGKAFERLSADKNSDDEVREVSLRHLVEIAVEQQDWRQARTRAEQFLQRFPESRHRPHVRFQLAGALLHRDETEKAQQSLLELKTDFAQPAAGEPPWVPQIWIMLAETYFRQKKYDDVESAVAALRGRNPEYRLLYQADEVLGRSYKNQARFDEAREAFRRVANDEQGRRTETAAKSQLLLAETYVLQKDWSTAQKEYFKVYQLYKFPRWQAAALFQVGVCDEALGQWKQAVGTYESLLEEFPESEYAAKAKPRLQVARKKASG